MPHAELKYSADLNLPVEAMFATIEAVIHRHDDASGECKCRAYPSALTNYPHLLVRVAMLTKPHRDDAFTDRLMADMETTLKAMIGQSCHFSMQIDYSPRNYVTNQHLVPGDALARYGDPKE